MTILSKEFLEQIGVHLDDKAIADLSDDIEGELYQRVLDEIIALSDDEDIVASLQKLAYMDDEEAQMWIQYNVEEFN